MRSSRRPYMLGPDADVLPCNGLARPLPIALVAGSPDTGQLYPSPLGEVEDKAGDGVLDAVPDRGVEFDHWANNFCYQVVAWR